MARILVADDNEDIRDTFASIIPRLNHEVVTVADAADAWELLKKGETFDLIISDNNMPK